MPETTTFDPPLSTAHQHPVPVAVAAADAIAWRHVDAAQRLRVPTPARLDADGDGDGRDGVVHAVLLTGPAAEPDGPPSEAGVRGVDGGRLLSAINFSSVPVTLRLPEPVPRGATLMMSTDPDRAIGEADLRRFTLLPCEAVLLVLPAD